MTDHEPSPPADLPVPPPAPPARSPGIKLLTALLLAAVLAIPLFAIFLLVYDRQSQSTEARTAIAAGWGGPQVLAGPVLSLPYEEQVEETVTENGKQVKKVSIAARELLLAPEANDLGTDIVPEKRRKSIYEAVVYQASAKGDASFALPADLARSGVKPEQLHYDRAELRFGLSDARGLVGSPPSIVVGTRPLPRMPSPDHTVSTDSGNTGGQSLRPQPGHGPAETGGSGFFAFLDASALKTGKLPVTYRLTFRGNGSLALAPNAGDTHWRAQSSWPDPSFGGGFLPISHQVRDEGFIADWRVGNLALGKPLAVTAGESDGTDGPRATLSGEVAGPYQASVDLVSPVDLYSEVNRSVKYGFLFIGFTFVALLMFDVIGGVRVATPEYLLVGAGLILFFVLLLALAEVIGFTFAYLLASAAIIGLIASYSAAVLRSWRRGATMAALLAALYAVLYVLLSLEAYSLLIGSVLLFAALAGVMYVTRRLDWSGRLA